MVCMRQDKSTPGCRSSLYRASMQKAEVCLRSAQNALHLGICHTAPFAAQRAEREKQSQLKGDIDITNLTQQDQRTDLTQMLEH